MINDQVCPHCDKQEGWTPWVWEPEGPRETYSLVDGEAVRGPDRHEKAHWMHCEMGCVEHDSAQGIFDSHEFYTCLACGQPVV